jgi:aminopeptidase N
MREPQPKAIQLKDYSPPAFSVETVDLDVEIRSDDAIVRAKLQIRRKRSGTAGSRRR